MREMQKKHYWRVGKAVGAMLLQALLLSGCMKTSPLRVRCDEFVMIKGPSSEWCASGDFSINGFLCKPGTGSCDASGCSCEGKR